MNDMSYTFRYTLAAVIIFSIAMGFLEAAVVVYLRDLYYPDGFKFPLVPITRLHSVVELIREASTIIMLMTIGWFAAKTHLKRFAWFLAAFAIWDLTYYAGLKLVLDWPASILEWDVLFLIPVPWFSPVLAPCIASVMMLVLSAILLRAPEVPQKKIVDTISWFFLISGSLIIITSFVLDYFVYILHMMNTTGLPSDNNLVLEELSKFIPGQFNWFLFGAGCAIIISGMIRIQQAVSKKPQKVQEQLA